MKVETKISMKIKLTEKKGRTFKSVIDKLVSEFNKAGFKRNLFSDEERAVIEEMAERISNS